MCPSLVSKRMVVDTCSKIPTAKALRIETLFSKLLPYVDAKNKPIGAVALKIVVEIKVLVKEFLLLNNSVTKIITIGIL